MVASGRETRESLVRLFAEHLLGAPFRGERLPIRQFDLDVLRRPFAFPTEPADDIEEVKVTLLRLMPLDAGGERITLECMRGAKRSIWQMADARFGEHDPLGDGYRITRARLVIRFRATPGVRGGRTLPVSLTVPKGCDIRDRTAQEQLIGGKYLRLWGLVRDIG